MKSEMSIVKSGHRCKEMSRFIRRETTDEEEKVLGIYKAELEKPRFQTVIDTCKTYTKTGRMNLSYLAVQLFCQWYAVTCGQKINR